MLNYCLNHREIPSTITYFTKEYGLYNLQNCICEVCALHAQKNPETHGLAT